MLGAAYVELSLDKLTACRVAEHMNLSVRSQLPIPHPNFSAIMQHHTETKHNLSPDDFTIFLCYSNNTDLRLIESLYIHRMKPSLNNNLPYDLNIVLN